MSRVAWLPDFCPSSPLLSFLPLGMCVKSMSMGWDAGGGWPRCSSGCGCRQGPAEHRAERERSSTFKYWLLQNDCLPLMLLS